MSGARVYGAPGQRTQERMASVGGPPWQVPVALIAAAVVAYVAGTLALAGAAGGLARGAWYGPRPLAAVHLVGLGFVSVTAVAALLQLVPVLLRTTLAPAWRGALAGAGLWLGAAAMAAGFLADHSRAVGAGGALLAAGAALFVADAVAALRRAARGQAGLGASGAGIAAAVAWFAAVVAAGALLAGNRADAFLGARVADLLAAHAAAALLGWLGGMILAVGLRLGPMFALSHGYSRRRGVAAMAMWHAAAVLVVAGLAADAAWVCAAGAALLALAAGAALWFVADVARHRRRAVEAPIVHLALGAAATIGAVVVEAAAAAGVLAPARAHAAAGTLVLVGLGAGVTAGHVFKVVPMLVWTGRYAARMGTPGTPTLADLYPVRLAHAELAAFAVGLALVVAGVLASAAWLAAAGAWALVLSALAVAVAVGSCVFGRGRGARAPAAPSLPNTHTKGGA